MVLGSIARFPYPAYESLVGRAAHYTEYSMQARRRRRGRGGSAAMMTVRSKLASNKLTIDRLSLSRHISLMGEKW